MNKRKSWQDLSAAQKVWTIVMGAVQVGLLIAALYDIRKRPAEQIHGSKKLWTGIAFINYVGPIVYFLFGRKYEDGECALCGEAASEIEIAE